MDLLTINLFQMKTKPENQEKAPEFISKGYVQIGWSRVPDMRNLNKEEIRKELADKYASTGRSLSTSLGTLNTFTKVMKSGDAVVMNHEGFVYIGFVGAYVPEEVEKGVWKHKRSCEWKAMVKKSDLKQEVRSLLGNMTTVTKFPYPFVTSGIPEILGIEQSEEQTKIVKIPPLEETAQTPSITTEPGEYEDQPSGRSVDEQLLSKLESLGTTALGILEEEMKSDDSERRRKAAVDLLGILNNTKPKRLIADESL